MKKNKNKYNENEETFSNEADVYENESSLETELQSNNQFAEEQQNDDAQQETEFDNKEGINEETEYGENEEDINEQTSQHEEDTEENNPHDHIDDFVQTQSQNTYLNDLMRLQAEFDNYRKRMQTALSDARQDGFIDAIEQFLPALDSFKMATDMITDQNTLMGIRFIEKGILDTLSKMGVEVIDTSGRFDPELHQAIDTDSSADVESGMIVKEAYKGFKYKGKVIRYAQVIVKK